MDPTQSTAPTDISLLIDDLVNTYRELNTRFRTVDEDAMVSSGARDIIKRMRGDELRFAQALKERVSGVGTMLSDDEDERISTLETDDDNTRMMISQFGNARATTLSLLKDVKGETLTTPLDDGLSILDHVRLLAQSDVNQLARLGSLLKA